MTRILRGLTSRHLSCGCVLGVYETYDGRVVIIIDVRLSGNLAESGSRIKGAVTEDPGKVEAWMDKYPKDKTLVFYCA